MSQLYSKMMDRNLLSNIVESVHENGDKWRLVAYSVAATVAAIKLYHLYDNQQLNLKTLKEQSFRLLIRLPVLSGIASKQLSDVDNTIANKFKSTFESETFCTELPLKALSSDAIIEELLKYQRIGKIEWKNGRASGTVYADLNSESTDLMTKVYGITAYTNPLHPDVFPGINKMEAEIVRMVCKLFNGDNESCGTMTSGGTESLILAVKACRDYGRQIKGITKPEMVVPVTAHAAFQKAAQMLNIRFKSIALDRNTFKVDLKAMRAAITRNTVMLVGSACNYPHGIIDDIEAIAKLGTEYDIPVHVDSCLGGFLVPFMSSAGYSIPVVDFSLPGVTSISADTHKYGFAPKGSSVIMYRNKQYRRHQYSIQTDWPGGIYASPTIAGSRCGASIANCWATLLSIGFEGYVDSTKKIIQVQRYLKTQLSTIEGIRIIGDPLLSVIALASDHFNIFRLSDMLSERGWSLNPLQFPSAVHVCVTLMHTQPGIADALLKDIREVVQHCLSSATDDGSGLGVIYGMAQSLPDRSMVSTIASHFLDGMYQTEWPQTNGK